MGVSALQGTPVEVATGSFGPRSPANTMAVNIEEGDVISGKFPEVWCKTSSLADSLISRQVEIELQINFLE